MADGVASIEFVAVAGHRRRARHEPPRRTTTCRPRLLAELTEAGLDPRRARRRTSCARSRRTSPAGARRHLGVATIPAEARTEWPTSAPARPASSPGLGVAALVFHLVHGRRRRRSPTGCPTARVVAPGDVVMRVAGPTRGLLTAERTALNFASHLSGVATATSHWVAALAGHPRPGARHPQDAARLPGPAEVRRALRRRRQPPLQPRRPGHGQGQPRGRRRRCRAGVRGRAGGVPGPRRWRSRSPTSTSCASCSTPVARRSCSTT